ncbi:MAG: S1 RNA-binding domain-containing protein [Anaerolineales bacterium]|nr:S1 RNA-binding domain-containing protein [Anaerolineales bacterium]
MATKKDRDLVHVRVIKHLPQGLSVELDNGEHGIIRIREISWDSEELANWKINHPVNWDGYVFSIPTKKGEVREFSLRLVANDPWDDFFDGYNKTEVFEGVVTSVFEYGAFIEIEPGITGLLHKTQLPPKLQSIILDLFWHNDKVFVMVQNVDHEQRQIELSLAPLGNFPDMSPFSTDNQPYIPHEAGESIRQALNANIPRRHILVVEDEVSQSEAVCGWLRELDQSVDVVHSAEEAIGFLSKTLPDIALVDVGLPSMSGTDLTRHILENYPQVQVVNATDWARASEVSEALEQLQAQGGKLLYKPLVPEDLVMYLLYEQDHQGITKQQIEEKSIVLKVPPKNSKKNIHTLMALCKKRLGVEHVFLFALDPAHRRIRVVERIGDGAINKNAITQLIYSPVRDVAEDRDVVVVNEIGEREHRRFQYLVEFLPTMTSCIGIPIPAQTAQKYALFAIDHREKQFGEETQLYAEGIALSIGAALDQNELREISALIQRSALIGNLASGMIHEINNLVAPLQYESDNLRKILMRLEKEPEDSIHEKIKNEVSNIEQDVRQIISTVNTFGKIAKKPKAEVLRVDEIVNDTLLLLREISKRSRVKMLFNPPEKMVIVRNQAVVLEQIVLNVTLNAIQQIVEHRSEESGQIHIAMELINETQNNAICRILVADNGPGIHSSLWEKIFEMGYSTRQDGSGIGLFVSRNLMEEIGGKIYVADSHILHGSVFGLEIPIEL